MATRIGDEAGMDRPELGDPAISPEPPPAAAEPPTSPYNATDVLPVAPPGGRRARREQDEAARTSRTTPTPLGRAVVPAAIAIVCAVALAAAWLHLQNDRQAAGAAAPLPSASPSAAAPTSASPSTSASASPTASPSAVVPPPAPSTPAATPTAAAPKVDRSVPVVVLNATARAGLAAKVAARLRADGWKVTSVGNWTRPGTAATTIYLNGHVNARATMIDDLPEAQGRVALPVAGMPPLRLVVVVGDDWPR